MTASLDLGDKILGKDSSNVSQPYGICVLSCEPGQRKCKAGTLCRELHHIQTRQPLAIFGCMSEVKEGESCANTQACARGLRCMRYGTKASTWLCQKECKESSNCGKEQRCVAFGEASFKVCQVVKKAGQTCNFGHVCEAGFVCVPSGIDEPARCRKACESKDSKCSEKDEVCSSFVGLDNESKYACLKQASLRKACKNGVVCAGEKPICVGINSSYAACFLPCTADSDCGVEEACDFISASSTIKICRTQVKPGEYFLNLTQCAEGGRALRLGKELPPVCLSDCTSGSSLEPSYCGALSPKALWSVSVLSKDEVLAVGDLGVLAKSNDKGESWSRERTQDLESYRSIAASTNGKVLWALQESGRIRVRENGLWKEKTLAFGKKAMYAMAADAKDSFLLLVGEKGAVVRVESPWGSAQSIDVSAGEATLRGVAVGEQASLVVGEKGAVFWSLDEGKTWSRAKTGGIAKSLFAVAWVPLDLKAPFQAIAVGQGGLILTSQDLGKTWTQNKTPFQQNLNGVAATTKSLLLVGERGLILRWNGKGWDTIKPPQAENPPTLRGLSSRGLTSVAVGDSGAVWWSHDAGKTWKNTASRFLRCMKIAVPNQPDSGACAHRCDPARKGEECPPLLKRCGEIRVGGQSVFVCVPPGPIWGDAKRGAACSPYEGADLSKRCQKGFTCSQTFQGHRCLKPCPKGMADCASGESCLYSAELGLSMCGKAVRDGETCAPEQSLFCQAGARCVFHPYAEKGVCVRPKGQADKQPCLQHSTPQLVCADGLVCAGSGATPYRLFCSKTCDWQANQGCESGWTCLPNASAVGVCVQPCQREGDSCSVKGLRCRRPFPTSTEWFCL